jgi:hypothetical protein
MSEKKALPASARTVIVCCKIEGGLKLQLQRKLNKFEDSREGPKPMSYNVFSGKAHYVHGPAYPRGVVPKGFPSAPPIEGGFAMTFGIPADFWEQWLEQNEKADFVTSGMIFAASSIEDAKAEAVEKQAIRSGLEPISTDEDKNGRMVDPRLPKPLSTGIGHIAREQAGS